MDIVSRIKTFLSANGIANSIFADKCEIPRPTLSQLLNGRNKKVSNEILDKIHVAYPELSIMWLMFGEGNMLSENGKNETALFNGEVGENENFDDENFLADVDANLVGDENQPKNYTKNMDKGSNQVAEMLKSLSKSFGKSVSRQDENSGAKRIVNIMVFYSDNSFESFVPNK